MFISSLGQGARPLQGYPCPGPPHYIPGCPSMPPCGKSSGKREWAKQWWILGEGPGGGGAEVLPSKFPHQTRMTEWTEIEELQDKK